MDVTCWKPCSRAFYLAAIPILFRLASAWLVFICLFFIGKRDLDTLRAATVLILDNFDSFVRLHFKEC